MKYSQKIGVAGILIAATLTIPLFFGVRVNLSDSAPKGVWIVSRLSADIKVGDIVEVCPPKSTLIEKLKNIGALKKGYCPSGTIPLLKGVAAIKGDSVEIKSQGNILINGQEIDNTAPLSNISSFPAGIYQLKNDEIFILSTYSDVSLDSRYLGIFRGSDIQNIAKPLLVSGNVANIANWR